MTTPMQDKMIDELTGRAKGVTVDQIMTSCGFSTRKSAYKGISRMRDRGYLIDGNIINNRVHYKLRAA